MELSNPDLEFYLEFFEGLVSITASPLDLDTESTTQLANGVKSSAESDLLSLRLDIDKALELFLNPTPPPPPAPKPPKLIQFNLEKTFELSDGFEAGAELNILDVGLSETAKLRQDITATVDAITGYLIMENGASIGYTVGNPITLPLSTYDANGDGQLVLNFDYTKKGTVANKTDFLLDTEAEIKVLGGRVFAQAKTLLGTAGVSYQMEPLFNPDPIALLSIPFNVYQDSWTVNDLGTGRTSQFTVS
jgi:hypothetical protein